MRVYPDAIHVDTHEPELTEAEITWGQHFWEQTWRAGNDEAAGRLAWHQLVERFDRPRAAWIARALTPLNLDDRPAQPVPDGEPLREAIKFPARRHQGRRVDAGAAHADAADALVGARLRRRPTDRHRRRQPDSRSTRRPDPTPSIAAPDPGDEALPVDEGMKWMTDFEAAERVGMGIRLRLTPEQAQGFDFLLVFGTKAAVNLPDRTAELAALLDAHHYTNGLGFALQGTPSNNTEDGPSGFDTADRDSEQSYQEERVGPAFEAGDRSNADVLTAALGLRGGHAATLGQSANANAREQLDASHMNRGMWPATWGYFLAQMIGAPLTDGRHRMGAGSLRRPRTRVRSAADAAGRQAAVRSPARDVAATSGNRLAPVEEERTREVATEGLPAAGCGTSGMGSSPRCRASAERRDPDRDFADVFSMDGLSSSYAIRHLMGEPVPAPALAVSDAARRTWTTRDNLTHWWTKQSELHQCRPRRGRHRLESPALARRPTRVGAASCAGRSCKPTIPSEDAPLDPNYIELLLDDDRPRAAAARRPSATSSRAGCCTRCSATRCCSATGRPPLACRRCGVAPPPDRSPVEIGDRRARGADGVARCLNGPAAGVTDEPLWSVPARTASRHPRMPTIAARRAAARAAREPRAPEDAERGATRAAVRRHARSRARIGSTPG